MKKITLVSLLIGSILSLVTAQQTVDPSWTQAISNAPFPPRFNPATVVFKNKLWVIGGRLYNGQDTRDIWSSSDGKSWERVTDAAACLPRQGHTALVFNNKLWVIAGATQKGSPVFYSRSDVWNSADGIAWEKVTDSAAFPSRVNCTSQVFNGKMWVLGGENTGKVGHALGDAWYSDDGLTWTLANASAFTPRVFSKSVVYQNKIWILGGHDHNSVLKDILSSPDGINWTTVQGITGFNPSDHFFLSTVYNNQVWVHDQYRVSNSSDMIHWNTVTTTGPYAKLGLHELDAKLWSIGTLTLGTSNVHPVYYYSAPALQKKVGSK